MNDKRSKPTISQPIQSQEQETEVEVRSISLEGKKLRQVFSIKEVLTNPDSYYKVFDARSRWIIMVVNFGGRVLKLRVINNVKGRVVVILNINYNRIQDLKRVLKQLEDVFSIVEVRELLKRFEEEQFEEESIFRL